jgi:tRNA threonylcarbamoyladenosine biosynthesis protein TsaE
MNGIAESGVAETLIEVPLDGIAATIALAGRLARSLRHGDRLLLDGPLGAGKTTLVRALVGALGGRTADVASPTFALVHQYATPAGEVIHADAYRLETGTDPDELGLAELADEALLCVEWASRLPALTAGDGCWRLELATMADDGRHAVLRIPPGRELRP